MKAIYLHPSWPEFAATVRELVRKHRYHRWIHDYEYDWTEKELFRRFIEKVWGYHPTRPEVEAEMYNHMTKEAMKLT